MGIHVIKMPDLGEGIAEVEVVAWHVQPGDTVKEDQVLADVMTDKATVEIPSPVAGTITSLGGAVGQSLAVGAELIRLEVEGAGNFTGEKAKQEPVKSAAATAPAEEVAEPQLEAVAQAESPAGAQARASAPAAPPPKPAAAPQRSYQNGPAPMRAEGEKPLAAPAVRQRAWDLGIELQFVHGSGPAGRILHSDLDAHVSGRRASAQGTGRDERYAKREGEQSAPVIGLRRKIAEKMQEAKRNIPHFTYVEEVDVTELEALRTQLNARYGAERGKLTFLPLLMRAVVLALRQYPMMNARYDDANNLLTQFEGVHLGIAAQTEAGLMVPVVRHAETLDPWAAAAEVARLADAARAGRATREELTGSTITITSLGPLGGIVTTPVLNRPEVAIIGPNRIVDRPMIRDGAMVARKMMNLSSSFDHRVIDGQVAAKFVQTIRGYLETPATIFVE
ncbi:dihydrolipoamide acetyltransferase family protein [Massilia alkalitolerans]|jgi:2-oxoisovalerate dehydrogenase E2 component (dihydrolipoyl transacylase)|uniref:dihydrolipoamide acetyltransferase family protein n=1 Tax=Massilia alkalitolerans TaxID=286638 RepID=UPI0004123343|nr:dihydrolipoamide acetyltransferase family protein [Massilia alkalitolerans]